MSTQSDTYRISLVQSSRAHLRVYDTDVDQVLLASEMQESDDEWTEHAVARGVEERINISLSQIAFVKRKQKSADDAAALIMKGGSGVFGKKKGAAAALGFDDYVWHDGTPLNLSERALHEDTQKKKSVKMHAPPFVRSVNSVSSSRTSR